MKINIPKMIRNRLLHRVALFCWGFRPGSVCHVLNQWKGTWNKEDFGEFEQEQELLFKIWKRSIFVVLLRTSSKSTQKHLNSSIFFMRETETGSGRSQGQVFGFLLRFLSSEGRARSSSSVFQRSKKAGWGSPAELLLCQVFSKVR